MQELESMFQFLIGSMEMIEMSNKIEKIQPFQFLIGSMEIVRSSFGWSKPHKFQFLIGSMEMGIQKLTIHTLKEVSIPYR